jgi:hypothetical protein
MFPEDSSVEEPLKKKFQKPKILKLWKYLENRKVESRHISCR